MPTAPLLIGEYTPPPVRVGQRVTCLLRDADCVVTSVSESPVSWPRVQVVGQRGGSGLWVCESLVTAIRTESALALRHHFGVSTGTVWRWRKAFGVEGRAGTKGSRQAIRRAARLGAAAIRTKEWTDAELDAKAATSKRLGLRPTGRWRVGGWTPEQIALLGTAPDEEVAAMIGRSVSAVRSQRAVRKIPAPSGSAGGGRAWTPDEVALLGTALDEVFADRIGRTLAAVAWKRWAISRSK